MLVYRDVHATYEETALIASVRVDQLTRVDNAKIRWDASMSTFEFLDAQEQDISRSTRRSRLESTSLSRCQTNLAQ